MKLLHFGAFWGVMLMTACGGESSGSTGQIGNLQINVGSNWREVPDNDPERRMFLSEDGTGVTISSFDVDIRPDQTETLAVRLAQSRLEGHERFESENGGHSTITEPVFQEHSWGHHIEYDGQGSDGRIFSFFGFITTKQVVSIFAEGPESDFSPPDYMHSTIQEFIQSVQFDRARIR